MTPEEERRRGIAAQQLLENEIFKECWDVTEQRIVNMLAQIDVTDERERKLLSALRGIRTARKYIESVAQTGQLAELEELRQAPQRTTWIDRVRSVGR